MNFVRIPMVAVALTAVTLTSSNATGPQATESTSARSAQGDLGKSTRSGAPAVLNALADENNTLVYMRVSQARYAAYYNDARSRCDMYRGKARAACVDEARMKFGPPF